MKLVFVFAMEEEAEYSIERNNYKLICNTPFKVYQNDHSLIVISGIGIARSSRCIGWIYEKYNPKTIFNIGLAGCISNNFNILDEIFIEKSFYSTVDVTGFGYKYGQIPKGKEYYRSTIKNLLKLKSCNIATSDIFINSKDKIDNYIKKLDDDNIFLIDMECASIMHSCDELNIECGSIKIISDISDKQSSNEDQFSEILEQGSMKISKIIEQITERIKR